MSEEVTFRGYTQEDLPGCAILARQAWPYRRGGLSDEDEDMTMRGYVRASRLWSNWTEVACDSQGIVGVIFGRIDKNWSKGDSFRMVLREALIFAESFVRRSGFPARSFGLIRSLFMTELKVAFLRPDTDAEIELLIVDSRRRGEGIGRYLVERFFDAVREVGSRRVTVYADENSSNWPFYENLGFKRVATFYDNLVSYYDNRHTNGLIYLLEIESPGQ